MSDAFLAIDMPTGGGGDWEEDGAEKEAGSEVERWREYEEGEVLK